MLREGSEHAIRAVFHNEMTRIALTPEKRDAKMYYMVEECALSAASHGNVAVLDFLSSLEGPHSYMMRYPIDEIAVRGDHVEVLEWCLDNNFYLQRLVMYAAVGKCKTQVTLLGLALLMNRQRAAKWLFSNGVVCVGNSYYIRRQIGTTIRFSRLLGSVMIRARMADAFLTSDMPDLLRKAKGSFGRKEVLRCAVYLLLHDESGGAATESFDQVMREVCDSVSASKGSCGRKLLKILLARYTNTFNEYLAWQKASCHWRQWQGSTEGPWRIVYSFLRSSPWRPLWLSKQVKKIGWTMKRQASAKKMAGSWP